MAGADEVWRLDFSTLASYFGFFSVVGLKKVSSAPRFMAANLLALTI
jgi:hypothetical protein